MALLARREQGRSPAAARLSLVGLSAKVPPVSLDPQEAKFNYFFGRDRQQWRTDVPSYGAVLYPEAYPGIDLKFYGCGRELEYDVIVKPGADLNRVRFACVPGADASGSPPLATWRSGCRMAGCCSKKSRSFIRRSAVEPRGPGRQI